MKYVVLLFILASWSIEIGFGQNQLPEIEIISASFDQSVEFLHIAYSIQDPDDSEFTVDALLSNDDGKRFDFPISSASGDIGAGIVNDGPKELILGCAGIDHVRAVARLIVSDNDTLDIQSLVDQVDKSRLTQNLMAIQGIRHRTGDPAHLDSTRARIYARLDTLNLQPAFYLFMMGNYEAKNIIGFQHGIGRPNTEYYVGGHYDTVVNSPGADDNGTAVAAMLEIAEILSPLPFNKTIRYVTWDLEESGLLGSLDYVNNELENQSDIQGYLNLEMIGYYSEEPNTQQFPPGFNLLFPDAFQEIQNNQFRGDFLTNVGNTVNSLSLMEEFDSIANVFVPELDVISIASPGAGNSVPDLLRSDHAAFWFQGIPAVMLTDGANFRNPHYHTENDVIDSLDMDFLTNNTKAVVAFLAAKSEYNHADFEDISSIPVLSSTTEPKNAWNIRLYPMPVIDELKIELSGPHVNEIDDVIIYSNNGRRLFSIKNIAVREGQCSFSTRELAEGMYFLMVRIDDAMHRTKFIVIR